MPRNASFNEQTQDLALDASKMESRAREERPCLIVLAGDRVGEMVRIDSLLQIGRGEQANFRIDDQGVSRLHVAISVTEDGVMATDLGSTNGTYVNEERIVSTQLHDGDKISFGNAALLKFTYATDRERNDYQSMFSRAVEDPLTGLFNRRYLMVHINSELSYSIRHKTPLHLATVDLRGISAVNKRYGREMGDRIIREAARMLRQSVRREDVVTRYEGDKFALVYRGIDRASSQVAVARVCAIVEGAQLVVDLPKFRAKFSIGIASVPDVHIKTFEDFLDAAEQELVKAKRA